MIKRHTDTDRIAEKLVRYSVHMCTEIAVQDSHRKT
jgi:hypothetical protein